jgi:hypothetical protein
VFNTLSTKNPRSSALHYVISNDLKLVWLYAVADVLNVKINIWKTSSLLPVTDSTIYIIRAYHVTHTLVMSTGKHTIFAKRVTIFNSGATVTKTAYASIVGCHTDFG